MEVLILHYKRYPRVLAVATSVVVVNQANFKLLEYTSVNLLAQISLIIRYLMKILAASRMINSAELLVTNI